MFHVEHWGILKKMKIMKDLKVLKEKRLKIEILKAEQTLLSSDIYDLEEELVKSVGDRKVLKAIMIAQIESMKVTYECLRATILLLEFDVY